MKIFVPHSKTDVYREGNYVDINSTNNMYCPVTLLARYIKTAIVELSSLCFELSFILDAQGVIL